MHPDSSIPSSCLDTVQWVSDEYQMSIRWVSDAYQMSIKYVSDEYQMRIKCVSNEYQMSIKRVSDAYQMSIMRIKKSGTRRLRSILICYSSDTHDTHLIRMILIRYAFDTQLIRMILIWYAFDTHLILIWYSDWVSDTRVIRMILIWYSSDTHLILRLSIRYSSNTHDTHLILIWYSPDTHDTHLIRCWALFPAVDLHSSSMGRRIKSSPAESFKLWRLSAIVWYSLLQLQGSAQQCRPTTLDAMQLCSKIPSSRCAECSSAPKYPAPAQQLLLFEQGQRISINVATTKHSCTWCYKDWYALCCVCWVLWVMLSIVRSRGALTCRFVNQSYFSWIHGGVGDVSPSAAGCCEADFASSSASWKAQDIIICTSQCWCTNENIPHPRSA